MNKIRYIILLSVFLASTCTVFGEEVNPWARFIKFPDSKNYDLCQALISKTNEKDKAGENAKTLIQTQLIQNEILFGRFLELVEKNNPYAIELAFQLRPFVDGASSEDLYISLGKTIKSNPRLLLKMMNKYELKEDEIESLILMYGSEFVDNFDKQIAETELREQALIKIKERQYEELRQSCLNILQKHKAYLVKKQKDLMDIDKISKALKDDPERALYMVKEANIQGRLDLSGILLGDLPNDNTRINKISERISLLEQKIKKQDLLGLKRECLEILNHELNVLLDMKKVQ